MLAADVRSRADRAERLSADPADRQQADQQAGQEYRAGLDRAAPPDAVVVLPVMPALPPLRTASARRAGGVPPERVPVHRPGQPRPAPSWSSRCGTRTAGWGWASGCSARRARTPNCCASRAASAPETARWPSSSVPPMTMQTRPLGRTGTDVTILGYGAMELRGQPRGPAIDDEDAGRLLERGARRGHQPDRHLDRLRPQRGADRPVPRPPPRRVLPGIQVRLPARAAARARAAVPARLPPRERPGRRRAEPARLRTDQLDLVQVHISPSQAQLEADETVETMRALREEGKVRFLGMSGILPHLADHIAMGVFDVFQIPYSAVQREHEDLIAAAARPGAGTLIRGGAAEAAPRRGQGLAPGPDRPRRGRRPAALGGVRDRGPARRHEPARVRAPLHPHPPGAVEHDRRHLEARSPASQRGDRREGPAPGDLYEKAKERLAAPAA